MSDPDAQLLTYQRSAASTWKSGGVICSSRTNSHPEKTLLQNQQHFHRFQLCFMQQIKKDLSVYQSQGSVNHFHTVFLLKSGWKWYQTQCWVWYHVILISFYVCIKLNRKTSIMFINQNITFFYLVLGQSYKKQPLQNPRAAGCGPPALGQFPDLFWHFMCFSGSRLLNESSIPKNFWRMFRPFFFF